MDRSRPPRQLRREGRRRRGTLGAATAGSACFLSGAFLARLLPPSLVDWGGIERNLGPWLGVFVTSPGFGGLAALVAAVVAFRAARSSARNAAEQAREDRDQRNRTDRKAQWWARAQWALNLTVSGSTEQATIGYRVLDSLGSSEWADEHEADVIAAATADVLNAVPTSSTEGRNWTRIRRGRQRHGPSEQTIGDRLG